MSDQFRLDELYKMTNYIYSEQNAHRPATATFAHFVEVCGLLTIHSRKKKREGTTFEDALCKALGWYFPLLAKFRVASVEELVFRKFPYVCAYCRQAPHVDVNCKTVKGTQSTVDHDALRRKYSENKRRLPSGLAGWQGMFAEIYPRTPDDSARSVVGLMEELGELAEAIRVFERFPKYFAGEAADVFSYLMGLANEYSMQKQMDSGGEQFFDFESEYLKRFPGLCVQCGYPVCVCPMVPDATVGRMAKELDLSDVESLFVPSFESYRAESEAIAKRALSGAGGYEGLAARFPFDRGEANHALVMFCLQLAEKVGDDSVANSLRSVAMKVAGSATYAGSPRKPDEIGKLLLPVQEFIKGNPDLAQSIDGPQSGAFPNGIQSLVMNFNRYESSVVAHGNAIVASPAERGIGSFDLGELMLEVTMLRRHLQSLTPSPETESAVPLLVEAETAAAEGKKAKVMNILSHVGSWATDVAAKVGAELIVSLAKGGN